MSEEEKITQEIESAPQETITPTEVVDTKTKKGKKKKSKARVIIEWILTGIFGVLFLITLVGQIDGMIHVNDHYGQQIRLGFGSFIVKTASMEPEYKVGTAIITYLESEQTIIDRFNRGENVDVTFMNNATFASVCPRDNPLWQNPFDEVQSNAPMTHRIKEIHNVDGVYYFVTAGINVLEPGDEGYDEDTEYRKSIQYQIFKYDQLLGVVKVNSPVLGFFFDVISSPIGLLIFLLVPAGYLIVTSIIDILKALKEAEVAEESGTNTPSSLDTISQKDRERLKKELLADMLNKAKEDKKDEK